MILILQRTLRRQAAVLLLVAAAASACGEGGGSSERPQVVASLYPLGEAARRVGGNQVAVANLTPVGAEPHDVELSSRQVDRLQDADVVFYVGGGFQPAVEEVAERRRSATIDVLDHLPVERGGQGHADEEDASDDAVDPHFWLDPSLMSQAVDVVERALSDARPAGRAEFARNAGEYRRELNELDHEFRRGLASCQRREVVTSHGAFHYLAKRYGLRQEAIAGLSPESEPDPQRLAQLADVIRRSGATTVFYETLVSPEIAQALAREAKVTTAVLNPLEGLTKEQTAAGQTYVSVMRENLAALRQGLGCA